MHEVVHKDAHVHNSVSCSYLMSTDISISINIIKIEKIMKNLSDMLCSTLLLFCFLSSSKVDAWGGLFNRFNPSMLSDLGYGGGSYGKELYSAAHSGVSLLKCICNLIFTRYMNANTKLNAHLTYALYFSGSFKCN